MGSQRAPRLYGRGSPRSRRLARTWSAACALSLLGVRALASGSAEPSPTSARESAPGVEWNVGLVAGAVGTGRSGDLWQSTRFGGGLRADALFGRERAASMGYGPYASITTAAFDDARLALGASVLVPALEDFPLVLSLGPMARVAEGHGRAGAEAWLFWGVRSFNFHGSYNLSNGLLLGAQTTFEHAPESALWVAAQVDALWPLLPFALLFGALGAS